MGSAEDQPLRFSNEPKLRKQMRKRGWTELMIREALQTTPEPWRGKLGPALRYTHTATGKKLMVHASSGKIFHLGTESFKYDDH
jgi:hypothetical protein